MHARIDANFIESYVRCCFEFEIFSMASNGDEETNDTIVIVDLRTLIFARRIDFSREYVYRETYLVIIGIISEARR